MEPADVGYSAREFEIAEASLEEVLAWVQTQLRQQETWTLHVVARCPGSVVGQLLLVGNDPTRVNV